MTQNKLYVKTDTWSYAHVDSEKQSKYFYEESELEDPELQLKAGYIRESTEEEKNRYFSSKVEIDKKANFYSISQIKRVIDACVLEIYSDDTSISWVKYHDKGKIRYCRVMTQQFLDFIRIFCFEVGVTQKSWVDGIINLYDSLARKEKQVKLKLRYAEDNSAWCIQLNEYQALKICNGEIKVISLPSLFKVFSHQKPIAPDLEYGVIDDINLLKKYVLFKNERECELYLDTVPAYFVPEIAKPINLVKGEPGASKSMFCRLNKQILDPSTSMYDGIKFPKDEKDWFSNCYRHAVLFCDNIGYLTNDQQDDCCRAATGMNIEVRKLYTNLETVHAHIKAILFINGIDFDNLKSDLLDRSIMWGLDRIPDNLRKKESELITEFNKDLPRIWGAIFKILAKAQEIYPKIKDSVPKDFRLSDFAAYAAACAVARGRKLEDFVFELKYKSLVQKDETISQSVVADPLIKFIQEQEEGKWQGTVTELLDKLTKQEFGKIEPFNGNERVVVKSTPKWWIDKPSKLGTELIRIAFALEYYDIHIEKPPRTGKNRLIKISLAKMPVMPVTKQKIIDEKAEAEELKI